MGVRNRVGIGGCRTGPPGYNSWRVSMGLYDSSVPIPPHADRAHIFNLSGSPGIDSEESIPPGWESIPGLLKRFTNTGSGEGDCKELNSSFLECRVKTKIEKYSNLFEICFWRALFKSSSNMTLIQLFYNRSKKKNVSENFRLRNLFRQTK
jgi:hypothetical protein